MKKIRSFLGIFLLVLCSICLLLGILSNWREYDYVSKTTYSKARIISVKVTKPRSGKAVAHIEYVLTYKRDGNIDTLPLETTRAFLDTEPIPSIETLKKETFYIHYIPKQLRASTAYGELISINSDANLNWDLKTGWFQFIVLLLIISFFVNPKMYIRREKVKYNSAEKITKH